LCTGGVDLLLHALTNITQLPVTKSIVKDSGMGKAIGSVEKHKICAGTPNEEGIKQRIREIKEAWNKSVKALKEKVTSMCVVVHKFHKFVSDSRSPHSTLRTTLR
jgi:hypothetical protein